MERGAATGGHGPLARHRGSRRSVLGAGAAVLAAGGLSGALAACGPRGEPGPAAPKVTGQQAKLVFMAGGTVADLEQTNQTVLALLKAKQPQVAIEWEIPKADRHVEFPVRLAAGNPPDLVFLNPDNWRQYAKLGAFLRLDPFIARDVKLDEYFPSAVEGSRYRGSHYYWGAQGGGSLGLYYNKDLFDQAGLKYPDEGWTWQTFGEAALRLTVDDQGRRGGTAGFDPHSIKLYGAETMADWRYEFVVEEEAGDILRPGGTRSNLDSPEALAGLQWLGDTVARGVFWPSVRYPNEALRQAQIGFWSGHEAMYVTLGGAAVRIHQELRARWDVAPIPKGKQARYNFGWWGGVLAAAASKYPGECWEFLKVYGGEQAQRDFMERLGWFPSLKKVMDERVWLRGIAINKKVFYAGNFAWRPQPVHKIVPASDYRGILNPALQTIWKGEATASQAMGGVIDQLNRLLADKQN